MKKVDIYTDGACSGNPGKGGWCAILIYKDVEKVISGGAPHTTNNRMELYSILMGLRALKEPCIVNVFSDSAYAVNAFQQGWFWGWKSKNWHKNTENSSEIKNKDLWLALSVELEKHTVTFIKVLGHSDNEYNNRCDETARKEIAKLP